MRIILIIIIILTHDCVQCEFNIGDCFRFKFWNAKASGAELLSVVISRAVTIRDMKPKSRHSDPRSCVAVCDKGESRHTPWLPSNHVTPACESWASLHTDFPSRNIACVLLAQTKDARLCVSSQIMRTRIHTLIERLASARHDNKENCIPTRMHVSSKKTS